ncbi:MAG: glycosyltransferase [Patescibacteria group bacterium]|nr:glycosyltransferase [Patescibacteria group bacterium]
MFYLSIIIPCYNCQKTLPQLLKSITAEKVKNLEVVLVDDGSKEKLKTQNSKLKTITYHLPKNQGPAYARNFGAKKARGKVLLFLDSDVTAEKGTIKEVVRLFQEDKYRVAATGVWDKKQKSSKFFPKFKALRDWSYWINERKADSYYYLFSTRIAAIRRDVFLGLGGFNEKFSGADVEDIEFTYRLAQKYRIDFDPKMHVYHEFEDFLPIAIKYFKRAYQWVEIFQNRKKFDPVATTGNEALTTLSAVGLLGSLVVLAIVIIFNLKFEIFNEFSIFNFKIFLFSVFCFLFSVHLWGVRKFLHFVYKEEGIVFAFKSFFVGLALYCFIFAGAGCGLIKRVLKP